MDMNGICICFTGCNIILAVGKTFMGVRKKRHFYKLKNKFWVFFDQTQRVPLNGSLTHST